MSGIISEAELLAVTLIFAAALVATGINLFLVLNMSTRMYLDKYVAAVVVHTDNSIDSMLNRGELSFVDVAKAIRSDSINVNKVDIKFLDGGAFLGLDVGKAYHILFKYSNCRCTVEYTVSGSSYILTIQEVAQ